MIYDNGQKWKCHSSCPSDANGGDVISFYMAWKGVDFKTAVKELSELGGGVPAPAPKATARQETCQPEQWRQRATEFIAYAERNLDTKILDYLKKERGLSRETALAFHLGYNPGNLYDDPKRWGLEGKKIWLPRGIVIPGYLKGQPQHIKIRRPLEGDALGTYIPSWNAQDGFADVKFGGPRGGRSVLFRLELMDYRPILLLVEGEWDAMLVWDHCADLCDVATLGGAQSKFDTFDLALLTRYARVLVIHDDDRAGEQGRAYITGLQTIIPRIRSLLPPAHDLTDYLKTGGDVRSWTANHMSAALEEALADMKTIPHHLARYRYVLSLATQEYDHTTKETT
jgi:DNA primase